jgi:hypothetical protein
MPAINPDLPEVGELNSTAEPKVASALSELVDLVNGTLDVDNLAASLLTIIRRKPSVTTLLSTATTGTLGGGHQAVPGLSQALSLAIGDVVLLDASLSIEGGTTAGDSAKGFWKVTKPDASVAMLDGIGRAYTIGGVASPVFQVPVVSAYVAVAAGAHTFAIYGEAAGATGTPRIHGVGGVSHARVTKFGAA